MADPAPSPAPAELAVIQIRGAAEHNLKHVDLDIPKRRLVVFTGPSGSGKSSLAFDTIYAEGQRRYVESLSAYARQFLGQMDKPDVDFIEGLSPAISIDQKSASRNPRSTVGTITEIYDYLRLLYARIGDPHCPEHAIQLSAQSVSQMVDHVLELPPDTRLMILAPLIVGRKGEQADLFEELPSVTLCLVTSELRDAPIFRITVDPSPENGLRRVSQVQVDKTLTVARERIGAAIGRLDDATMLKVNRSLAVFIGIA